MLSELRECIDNKGVRLKFVANKIGLTYQGFHKKMMGESDFTSSEIMGLSDLLGLTADDRERIFFTHSVE